MHNLHCIRHTLNVIGRGGGSCFQRPYSAMQHSQRQLQRQIFHCCSTHTLTWCHLLYLFIADRYVQSVVTFMWKGLCPWAANHYVCVILLLVVRELLNSGVSPDLINEDGLTALHQVHKHTVAGVTIGVTRTRSFTGFLPANSSHLTVVTLTNCGINCEHHFTGSKSL